MPIFMGPDPLCGSDITPRRGPGKVARVSLQGTAKGFALFCQAPAHDPMSCIKTGMNNLANSHCITVRAIKSRFAGMRAQK